MKFFTSNSKILHNQVDNSFHPVVNLDLKTCENETRHKISPDDLREYVNLPCELFFNSSLMIDVFLSLVSFFFVRRTFVNISYKHM